MISRRDFGKMVGTGSLVLATGGSALLLGGCNAAQDIINWEPTAEDALSSIETILMANGIAFAGPILLAFQAAQAALVAVKAAAQEYLATTPAPVTTTQKLLAALKAAVDQIGTFVQALALPVGNILNLVLSLVQLIFSTIAGFTNEFTSGSAVVGDTLRVNNASVPVIPKKRTKREFKNDWNGTLNNGSATLVCPKSAYLKLSLLEHL